MLFTALVYAEEAAVCGEPQEQTDEQIFMSFYESLVPEQKMEFDTIITELQDFGPQMEALAQRHSVILEALKAYTGKRLVFKILLGFSE